MDAINRAEELWNTPTNKLPKLAFEYMKYRCNKYGMCNEVCLTALAHYAQVIEKLPCKDYLYIIDKEGKEYFKKMGE